MDKIVEETISKIQELEHHIPKGKHVVTGDFRKLSSNLFKQIKDKSSCYYPQLQSECYQCR